MSQTSQRLSPKDPAYRWHVLARVLTAALGGYLISACAGVFLSYALPLEPAQGVVAGALVSFALFTAIVMWVFAAASTRRALVWVWGVTGVSVALALWLTRGVLL
ncbi:hypothetical protein [Gilvimarinus algae]|uniref:Iron transporter n=1 Tax=Gilvimarinus algae TaxID=3058037 RepID=A0ABT8TI48_9GAMM|nr:hypothetical protein [Gilvimarinus sp. SDUM040014]MDO3382361.1 hypothetical protein [Gilvimarinus sp. SDUM040014]